MTERHIRKVVILGNPGKRNVDDMFSRLTAFFSQKGIESCLVRLSSSEEDLSLDVPECDLAVSLGGDINVSALDHHAFLTTHTVVT